MGLDVNGGSVLSMREEVLKDAGKLTGDTRDKVYGPPMRNLDLQGLLFKLYKEAEVTYKGAAHDAAMMNVFAKIARSAGCAKIHRDNYVDGAAYLAIAYEVAVQAKD